MIAAIPAGKPREDAGRRAAPTTCHRLRARRSDPLKSRISAAQRLRQSRGDRRAGNVGITSRTDKGGRVTPVSNQALEVAEVDSLLSERDHAIADRFGGSWDVPDQTPRLERTRGESQSSNPASGVADGAASRSYANVCVQSAWFENYPVLDHQLSLADIRYRLCWIAVDQY